MTEPMENGRIILLRGDITTMDVDAIVNPSNNDLILGAGISGAIRRIGGATIQEECHAIGTIPLGEIAETTSGDMRCGSIIHAAVNPLGLWADANSVRNGTRSSLKLAAKKELRSLAFPPLGCDAGGFSLERCAAIMAEEAAAFLSRKTSLEEIYFVLYDEKSHLIFEEKLKEVLIGWDLTPPSAPARKPLDIPKQA